MLWLREKWDHLSFWRSSLFRSHVWSNLRPIPVMRPIVVLLVFSLFCRHFGGLWVLPKLTICPFRLPEKMSNFAKNATKLAKKKHQKDKCFHSHACTSQYTHIFQRFLHSGNPHNLKNPQVCHVPVWNPSCATSRFRFAARQLPKTRNRCRCTIYVGESSV